LFKIMLQFLSTFIKFHQFSSMTLQFFIFSIKTITVIVNF